MKKPVVFFYGPYQLIDYANGQGAVIHDVRNHPRLGNEPVVYTSKVVSIDKGTGAAPAATIETMNTIYKQQVEQ